MWKVNTEWCTISTSFLLEVQNMLQVSARKKNQFLPNLAAPYNLYKYVSVYCYFYLFGFKITSVYSMSSLVPFQFLTTVKQEPGRVRGRKQGLTAGMRPPRHCHLLRHLHRLYWGSAVKGQRHGSSPGSSRPWPAVEAQPMGWHQGERLRSYGNRSSVGCKLPVFYLDLTGCW